jgi:hypothetical protein
MDKWMNVAGRAGTGAAIAGVSMTYYALMRRNAEIEKQSQTQEVVLPRSDEEVLEAIKEGKTDDDDEDSRGKSGGNLYRDNMEIKLPPLDPKIDPKIKDVLNPAELIEFDSESLTDSECVLSDELPWFTQSSNSVVKSSQSEDKINGNIILSNPCVETNADLPQPGSGCQTGQKEDSSSLFSSSNNSLSEDSNDDSSTTLESCPEPAEPPPVLTLTPSGRIEDKSSGDKEVVPSEFEPVSHEYIPADSWIAWPLKFFPARYNSYVLAAIAVFFWLVCAFVTYWTLEFCYYSMGWKQVVPTKAAPSINAPNDAPLDMDNVEEYEYSMTSSQWHW